MNKNVFTNTVFGWCILLCLGYAFKQDNIIPHLKCSTHMQTILQHVGKRLEVKMYLFLSRVKLRGKKNFSRSQTFTAWIELCLWCPQGCPKFLEQFCTLNTYLSVEIKLWLKKWISICTCSTLKQNLKANSTLKHGGVRQDWQLSQVICWYFK